MSALSPKLVPMPTKSYWHTRNVFTPASGTGPHPLPLAKGPLRQHESDICIVGAGIAGCSLAHHLMQLDPDVSVTLIDGRHIAGGATGRNGGLLWPCLNASLVKVVATKGRDAAVDILRFEEGAAQAIRSFLEDNEGMAEQCECSFFKDGALQLFESEEEAARDLADTALMQSLGFGGDLDIWDGPEARRRVGSDAYRGAIRFPKVARVWAARLALGLASSAARSGRLASGSSRLTVIEAAEVLSVEEVSAAAGMAAFGAEEEEEEAYMNGGQGRAIGRDSPFYGPGGKAMGTGGGESGGLAAVGAASGVRTAGAEMECFENVCKPLRGVRMSGSSAGRTKTRPSGNPQADLSICTSRGDVVRCRSVVHCTNAYSARLLPELQGKLVPVRNQVAITAPLTPSQALPLDAAVYARDGFVYYSPRSDGRLVLGGFRDVVPHKEHGTFDDGVLDPLVSDCLRRYMPTNFPLQFGAAAGGRAPEFEMEWSGILGFTEDRFPLVGKLSAVKDDDSAANRATSRAGQYICAGFSGHGMTRTYSCAEGLARMVLGLPQGPVPLPSAFMPEGRL